MNISRRKALLTATATAVLACLPVVAAFAPEAMEANPLKSTPPNIILVLTDDQGYGDMSCHGHPFLKTPNIDKLSEQSTRFTDFHVSATCGPTRAALMSGKAPFKVGITHTNAGRERMALSATTVAEMLRDAGYTTGIFGKWHLGDADPYQPRNRGFDEEFIFGGGRIGQKLTGTVDVPDNSYFDPVIRHNGNSVKTKGFCTDVFFKQALGWIKANQGKKPFFAYLSTNAPHGPFIAPEEYKKMFSDLPEIKAYKGKKGIDAFFGMVANIDDNLGVLMDKLDEWGLSENTLLIFMNDNGAAGGFSFCNAGLKDGKCSHNEGGTKAACFMRLPGLTEPGVDVDRLARHYDLFPTFAELAGAELSPDPGLDGRSLIPLIEDPGAEWPDRMSFIHRGQWAVEGIPLRGKMGDTKPESRKYSGFAVRTDRWRLVGDRRAKETRDSANPILNDIKQDPGQKKDVAKQNPEVVETLLTAYEKWWDEVRPLMINEDAPLVPTKESPYVVEYEEQKETTGIPAWVEPEL